MRRTKDLFKKIQLPFIYAGKSILKVIEVALINPIIEVYKSKRYRRAGTILFTNVSNK